MKVAKLIVAFVLADVAERLTRTARRLGEIEDEPLTEMTDAECEAFVRQYL